MKTQSQKIQVLNKIIKEYAKHFKYFDDAKVFNVGLRFVIRFYNNKNNKNYPVFTRKFPYRDIDKIIKRYRSKLDYEIKKTEDMKKAEHYKPKTLRAWQVKNTIFFVSMMLLALIILFCVISFV